MSNEVAVWHPPSQRDLLLAPQKNGLPPLLRRRLITLESVPLSDLSDLIDVSKPDKDLEWAIIMTENAIGTLCDPRTAAECVNKVSVTLQVALPASDALEGYYEVLCQYPAELVLYGTEEVIKSHRYATFPKPGDWVKHIDVKIAEADAFLKRLKRMQSKIALANRLKRKPKRAG
jgi:hypothetical protein